MLFVCEKPSMMVSNSCQCVGEKVSQRFAALEDGMEESFDLDMAVSRIIWSRRDWF
jgi:hypothetical protein